MTDKQNYFTYIDNTSDNNYKTMENLHKQIIIDGVDVSGCGWYTQGATGMICADWHLSNDCSKNLNCYYKQLKRKEQELEELRQYHNKCCEENAKKEAEWLEKFNQISIGFYNGDYCNTEHCSLLKAKEQECEELKKGLNLILTVQKNCKECPHQKLDVDVLVCDLDCATAFKKIAKQTLKKLENKNV